MDSAGFSGVELGAVVDDETQTAHVLPEGEEIKPRGFADPEIRAKAEETRRANRPEGAASFGDNDGKPKRGRKPGSSGKEQVNLRGITEMLVGIHGLLAMLSGFQDICIDKDEGEILAKAIADLGAHYKIKIDGKTSALLGVIYAVAIVYGPRAVTIGKEIRDRKRANVG